MDDSKGLDEIRGLLQELVKLTLETVKWTKVTSFSAVRIILENTLKEDNEKLAYDLTEPGTTAEEIAKVVEPFGAVTARTIQNWWKKWARLGLITEHTPKQRAKNFSLDDFEIKVPKVVKGSGEQVKKEEEDSAEEANEMHSEEKSSTL
jgi:hypothetical protein